MVRPQSVEKGSWYAGLMLAQTLAWRSVGLANIRDELMVNLADGLNSAGLMVKRRVLVAVYSSPKYRRETPS